MTSPSASRLRYNTESKMVRAGAVDDQSDMSSVFHEGGTQGPELTDTSIISRNSRTEMVPVKERPAGLTA